MRNCYLQPLTRTPVSYAPGDLVPPTRHPAPLYANATLASLAAGALVLELTSTYEILTFTVVTYPRYLFHYLHQGAQVSARWSLFALSLKCGFPVSQLSQPVPSKAKIAGK